MANVDIIITSAETDPVRLTVNGRGVTIPLNKITGVDAYFIPALSSADIVFKQVGESESAPAAVAVESAGGGDSSGSDTITDSAIFDPEAVITGNVSQVAAKLAGLSAAELEAVRAAEVDREQPRKGVIAAIEEAIAAFPAA